VGQLHGWARFVQRSRGHTVAGATGSWGERMVRVGRETEEHGRNRQSTYRTAVGYKVARWMLAWRGWKKSRPGGTAPAPVPTCTRVWGLGSGVRRGR
jgi:hypothetical protein